ncbi:uncharacterized protein [Haliotis cracherodii]|uniref:uncharacterized protein isoform X1 n=1 Tax=Haliotis cracherodii TaxID=6455 RepID=UPI0039E805AF
MSETSEPTPDGSTSADDGSSSNTTATSTTSPTLKSSISTTSGYPPGPGMNAGTGVGVAIGVGLLLIGCVLVLYYLHRTGRLKWFTARGRPRRSSTSSSRRPLEPDDTESVDAMPRVTDGDMFAIADDHDHDHDREQAEDGYFYDEVFGSSEFEDETTKASNKELFSVSSDEVPDLLLRVDPVNFK